MKQEIDSKGQNDILRNLVIRRDTICKVIILIIKEIERTDKNPITRDQGSINDKAIFGEVIQDIHSVLIYEPGGHNVPTYQRGKNGSFNGFELLQVLRDELEKLVKRPIRNHFQLNDAYNRIEYRIRDLSLDG